MAFVYLVKIPVFLGVASSKSLTIIASFRSDGEISAH
jgi:hypothetical protein